jgi:hypothetical protein
VRPLEVASDLLGKPKILVTSWSRFLASGLIRDGTKRHRAPRQTLLDEARWLNRHEPISNLPNPPFGTSLRSKLILNASSYGWQATFPSEGCPP